MAGPLDGITILDFTWALAGPFSTMQLCDLGARVWKVEVVGLTEEQRGPGPMVDGVNTYFFSVNRGKESITLDVKNPKGRELALSLAEKADVLTENFTPGTMKRLGLGYEDVAARNPGIVYASTSGFGQDGPYAGRGAYDVLVQGVSGVMSITGHADGPPARVGYSIGDMAGGLFTAIGILSALLERTRSGRGQYVDISMLDAQVNLLENAMIRYFATGEVPGRIGTRHPLITPFQAFPTLDGYIVVARVKDWQLFCAMVGCDELVTDPRFADNELRTQNHAALEPVLNATFAQKTTAQWLDLLSEEFFVAPLNTLDQMAADPQVNHRGMFVDLPSFAGRSFRAVNSPVHLSRTPPQVTRGADSIGGHTRSILKDALGLTDSAVDALVGERVVSDGAAPAEQ